MAARSNRLLPCRYWPAWLTLLLGLAASAGLALMLHRRAVELDQQRFKLEAAQIAALLESTMERYEERLARLADHCAQFDELPAQIWFFRRERMTDLNGNLPNVTHALYCPRIAAADFAAHAERGRIVWPKGYAFDPEARPDRDFALPVWQSWTRHGYQAIPPGTDLAEAADWRPALTRGLRHTRGGVSAAPARVPRQDGSSVNGFWFTLALFKRDQTSMGTGQGGGESTAAFSERRARFHETNAIGVFAAFISSDRLVDESFNSPKYPLRIHTRLYTTTNLTAATLLNPNSKPPVAPLHRYLQPQPWYGQRWMLEFTSTPRFEADSARYLAWLVLYAGAGLTLLASALLAVSLHARLRQETMTEQIREARDALTAAQQERERLSRDLHDGTVQSLYAIQLGLGHTAQKLAGEAAQARRELSTVRAELDAVIAEIRRFITADDNAEIKADLAGVIQALVQRAKTGATAKVELHCDPNASSRLTGNQAVQLANIAREALSNSLRHARPHRIEVRLAVEGTCVCLEIADDGGGFNPQSPARPGVGLASMASRATEIGGRLEIQSAPGAGTRVSVRVPASPGRAAGPQ